MVFGKWMRRLFSREQLNLVVEGEIIEQGTHQPRTHLGPEQAPEEAWFGLRVDKAGLSDGTSKEPSRVIPAEFSGPLELRERFAVGDRVKITCSTPTGRLIQEMVPADR